MARDLGRIQFVDRGMTLAAHAFTSIVPILIIAGALRSRLDSQTGPIFAEHLGLDAATAEILQRSLPAGEQELRATGVIGIVLLVIAATSFARALERSFRVIWHTPPNRLGFGWRWLAALAAVVIGLALVIAARILVQGDGALTLLEFVIEVVLWSALWWIASWIVIDRRVTLRELLPGSVLAGLGFAVAGIVGRAFLPLLLADSAHRFGVLGMTFAYIGWLLALAMILLVAVTAGRVVHLTYAGRAWRQSASASADRR
ncbi:YhjD/YihY/BrkB family envelope integrity protein [Microbacterium sp. Root180]|uniref:YhjD/YihY/BrkB family envelope integrity protein n=1 Tax=Microbacterium sp. Root180 TaxID=1736483 RepID=UPI0006F77082|nr:YhjD/YihY/BrkB family envelope integrity protein [Microbacterium sp. Root180]KRB36611.1 hypothetical protein ASD93_11190 [Microbacterium sp. Root180]